MATLSTLSITLADWAKRQDPNEKTARIVEILNQSNEILADMMWLEGNLPTGHRTTIRTGLPSATWRRLNYGVPKAKSTTVQVTDACGMLEVYSENDKDLVELNGDAAAFRMSEDVAFIEGISQQVATAIFYESQTTSPERITGLSPRYNSLSAGNATNIIDALGSGSDNTSMWLVVWGDRTVHGIYPKASKVGLSSTDKGVQTVLDSNTPQGQYEAYRTHYQWKCGMSLRDWRYVVRVCNIDVSDLAGATPANLINYLIRAIHKIPNLKSGKAAIYANRAIMTWLDIQALNKTNVWLGRTEFDGAEVTSFRGIPLRTVDAILNTEARIT